MGNNLDLVELLGIKSEAICPRCSKKFDPHFDDYDIECGEPNASSNDGFLTLDCYCHDCEFDFEVKIKSKVVEENE